MKSVQTIHTDVLVVGGGTSGCLAALAAAEEGARVVLVESDSALGGVATRGGIHRYYYGSPGGLQELVDRRTEEMARLFGGKTKGYHPEAKRAALSQLCAERQVDVRLNTLVYRVLTAGRTVAGVGAVAPDGEWELRARVTLDCTGNGSVVRMAGGSLRYGRELDGIYHNYSYIPRGMQDGVIGYDNLDAGWVDPYDPLDVSRAYLRGRDWIRETCNEGARYFGLSSMLGIREGGRIEGDACIRLEDYIEDAPSPDVIARSYSHLDNHGFDTGNESGFSQLWISVLGLFTKGLWCDIPYGCLLPRGLEGIAVGGRALSADRDVSMGVRMQKDMHKVGEAAGVAVALSVRTRRPLREIDRAELRRRLLDRGVLQTGDLNRQEGRNLRFVQGPLAHASLEELTAAEPQAVNRLLDALGTEEGWKAIWLLARRIGPRPSLLPALTERLARGTLQERMGSAITLCMMDRQEPVPFLLELLAAREQTKLGGHPKCVPLWVAAFILLRMLRSRAALEQALSALEETDSSVFHTFLLDYLHAAEPGMTAEERNRTAGVLECWIGRPDLGADYRMHGDRPESLRWSLELRAAALLSRCGREGEAVRLLKQAGGDSRGYVRRAADRLLGREDRRPIPKGAAGEPEGDLDLGAYDAAVIGGGLAGVVCAAKLAGSGLRVVLTEGSGCLLTEITRERRTRWTVEEPLPGGETAAGRLIRCLQESGAYRDGEAEPVLTQLAADRFLLESGTDLIFEALLREASELESGDVLLRMALKNGSGTLRVRHVVNVGVSRDGLESSLRYTHSAVVVHPGGLEAFHAEIDTPDGPVRVRLRPSYYPDEAYLDFSWNEAGPASDLRSAALIGYALRNLRERGILPEDAAVAYIADVPWVEKDDEGERPSLSGRMLQAGRLLQKGEEAADRVLQQRGGL